MTVQQIHIDSVLASFLAHYIVLSPCDNDKLHREFSTIKALADEALRELSSEFDRMYAEVGRPSIPPERLLKASLLIALFSVGRSARSWTTTCCIVGSWI